MHRAILAVLVALLPFAPAFAQDPWEALRKGYEKLFTPLPVKRIFADLEDELRICRRDPTGDRSRAAIRKRRNELDMRRATVLANRGLRKELVTKIAASGHERASGLLMDAYGRVTKDIERARKVHEQYVDILRIDINPGVDPGGIYWKNWARGELSAAGRILSTEEALRDQILAALRNFTSPELRNWLLRGAASDDEATRLRMLETLARSQDAECVAILVAKYGAARATGERVLLARMLGKSGAPAAAAALRASLADPEWCVRAAAIAGLRWFGWEDYKKPWGLRDAITIEALILALEREKGRLRLEVRDALMVATGHAGGIDPGTWSAWWESKKPGWKPRAGSAKLTPIPLAEVSRFFGIRTTSRRVVFLISRGESLERPVRRREKANDGGVAPEPKIDTAYRIAAWEFEEALATFPEEALFSVIVYGERMHVWSKKLKPAKKANRESAVKFVRKYRPGGGADLGTALETALRIGMRKSEADLTCGGEDSPDTIMVVGGNSARPGSLMGPGGLKMVMKRLTKRRPVRVHGVCVWPSSVLRDVVSATGGTLGRVKVN